VFIEGHFFTFEYKLIINSNLALSFGAALRDNKKQKFTIADRRLKVRKLYLLQK